jgi:hypothetical protein
MALLSATVAADGTLVNAAGAVSVQKGGTGVYTVTFDRALANCSCTASIGTVNTTLTVGDSGISANCPLSPVLPNHARIFITVGDVLTDQPFQLIAFCPR